jgi:hypothetical protein
MADAAVLYPHRIEPSRLMSAIDLPITHCPELGPRCYKVASRSGREPWDVNLDNESPAQLCPCEDFTFKGALHDCAHVLKARLVERESAVWDAYQIIKLHEVRAQRERERRERRRKTT